MSADGADIALVPDAAARELSLTTLLGTFDRVAPALLALGVFAVAAWAFRPYPVGIFHDDGVYLILARALASGQGYRYLHIPGAPLATHYPPGYPLFLATLLRVVPDFPRDLELLLLVNAGLLALVAWGVDRYARVRLQWPRPAAALAAITSTLTLPLLTLGGTFLSEVFFLALLFPFVFVAEEAAGGGETSSRRALLLGIGAGALTLVRIFALPIALVVAILFAARQRWRTALLCLAGAALVLFGWQLWVGAHAAGVPRALRGSYGSYVAWYVDGIHAAGSRLVTAAVRVNAIEMGWLLSDRFAPWTSAVARLSGLAIAIGLVVLGLVRLRRRAPVLAGFTLACLAITIAFPSSPWRYFWALWPMVVLLLGAGVESLLRWRPERHSLAGRAASVAILTMLAAGCARAEWTAYRARAWEQPARSATVRIAPLVRWVDRNTQPQDVLLADDEPLVFLYTGRQALPPVPSTSAEYVQPRSAMRDVAAMRGLLEQYPARYVITVVPWTNALLRGISGSAAAPVVLRDSLPGGGAFEVERR